MVVKSATKKKLMDLGIAENFAHTLADDKKWDDVKILAAGEIAQLCETDSATAAKMKDIIDAASKKGGDSNSENTGPTTKVSYKRRKGRLTARAKTAADLDAYGAEEKLASYIDPLADDPVFKSLVAAAEDSGSTRFTNRIFHDLTVAIHARGKKKLTKPQAKKVVNEVLNVRLKVWFNDLFTLTLFCLPRDPMFSRIRSNTTTVSFNE